MSRRRLGLAVLAASALAGRGTPARGQDVVRQWYGDVAYQKFGSPLHFTGDVNADGFIDIAIAAPWDSTAFAGAGMVRVVSGADGAVLWTWYGDQAGARLGNLGDALGDVDGDGYDDVLTNESEYDAGSAQHVGRVFVFSGKDGSTLLQIDGTSSFNLGGQVCGTGDVDADGVPDFAVGNWQMTRVTLFSGASGKYIRALKSPRNPGDFFGICLGDIGDLDGDLVPDLLVSETACYYNPDAMAYAFSGATGNLLWQTSLGSCGGGPVSVSVGRVVRVVGDVDGDGFADFCTGVKTSVSSGPNFAYAQIYSGKDGSLLYRFYEPQWLYQCAHCWIDFGDAVATAGDVDGDGLPDVQVADPNSSDHGGGDVFFFSGLDGTPLFHFSGGPGTLEFGLGLDGGVDVDGDGRLDTVGGDTWNPTKGSLAGAAFQIGIGGLILDSTPRFVPTAGYPIRLSLTAAPPGNPNAIFLVAMNGVPQFSLLQFGTFDSHRHWSQFYSLNGSFRGSTVTLRAFAIDANGHVVASNDETITFL